MLEANLTENWNGTTLILENSGLSSDLELIGINQDEDAVVFTIHDHERGDSTEVVCYPTSIAHLRLLFNAEHLNTLTLNLGERFVTLDISDSSELGEFSLAAYNFEPEVEDE